MNSELRQAREAGLSDDDQSMTDAYRRNLREKITQGMQSLRKGKGSDGDAFMAQLDAELAELERQGQ